MRKTLWLVIGLLALLPALTGCSQPAVNYVSDLDLKWGEPSQAPEETPAPTDIPKETPVVPTPTAAEPQKDGGLLGTWDGSFYVNPVLKFTAALPDGWYITSDEMLDLLSGYARETIESTMDVSTESTVMLMMCSEQEYDLTLPQNPNINITYSKQQYLTQMFSNPYFLDLMTEQLRPMYQDMYNEMFMEEVNVSLTGESNVSINNKDFIILSVTTEYSGGMMYQDQYITEISEGFLTITLSSFDEIMRDKMPSFIDNIMFE